MHRESTFRATLWLWEYGALTAVAGAVWLLFRFGYVWSAIPGRRLVLIALVFSMATGLWWFLTRRQDAAWRRNPMNPDRPPPPTSDGGHTTASNPAKDFLRLRSNERIFSGPDLPRVAKAAAAAAVGWALGLFHVHSFGWGSLVRSYLTGRFMFGVTVTAIFTSIIFGYMRARIRQTQDLLMNDRGLARDATPNVRMLRRPNFQAYTQNRQTTARADAAAPPNTRASQAT